MNDDQSTEVVAEPPAAALASDATRAGPLSAISAPRSAPALFSTKAIIIKLAYAEGIERGDAARASHGAFASRSMPRSAGLGRRAAAHRPGAAASAAWSCAPRSSAMLGYWFASYTDFLGLVYISAQFERLILFTYPAFVVILGALFFAQPIRRATVIGIAISYLGLALIFATKLTTLGADVAKGAALVLAAAIAFALYQLLAKDLIGQIGPRLFTCIAMSGAAAAALLQFALTQPLASLLVIAQGLPLRAPDRDRRDGAAVLSAEHGAAAHLRAGQRDDRNAQSPVVTILLAVVILGEHFTLLDAAARRWCLPASAGSRSRSRRDDVAPA